MAVHYDVCSYGSVNDYVKECLDYWMTPTFHCIVENYWLLWNDGLLTPDESSIRVMLGDIGDLSYQVKQDGLLEGILANIHGGEEGIFNVKQVFSSLPQGYDGKPPYFETELGGKVLMKLGYL